MLLFSDPLPAGTIAALKKSARRKEKPERLATLILVNPPDNTSKGQRSQQRHKGTTQGHRGPRYSQKGTEVP